MVSSSQKEEEEEEVGWSIDVSPKKGAFCQLDISTNISLKFAI